MFLTMSYKSGWIHLSNLNNHEKAVAVLTSTEHGVTSNSHCVCSSVTSAKRWISRNLPAQTQSLTKLHSRSVT